MDFHTVVDRLEGNRLIFEQLFSGLSREDAAWKPSAERWSFLEVLCHMVDIEREDFRVDLDIILNRPQDPWPSFSIMDWVTSRHYNEQDFNQKLEELDKERRESIQWLRALGDPDLEKRHSGNGFKREPMRAGDVMASWLAHDHFHFRQISLLYYDLLERPSENYKPQYSGFER